MPNKDDVTRFDVRCIKYHLRRGTLTHDELRAHLDNLPDEAEHGEETQTRFVPTVEQRERAGA